MTIDRLRELVTKAFEEVEADIYYAIKTKRLERDYLLNQLDVISKAKERIDAKLEYPDPAA